MLSRVVEMNVKHFPFLQTLLATGVVTSPNYPDNYPNSLEKTDTIQVEQGLILSLQFTAFDIHTWYYTCGYDHLTITDGDGTTLMEKSCGNSLPAAIRSTSNIVNLVFITSRAGTSSGWSVNWSAVTPGECQQCNLVNLLFPFNKNKTCQLLTMLSKTPDAFNPSKPCLASLSSFEFYCDPSFQKIKDQTRWS